MGDTDKSFEKMTWLMAQSTQFRLCSLLKKTNLKLLSLKNGKYRGQSWVFQIVYIKKPSQELFIFSSQQIVLQVSPQHESNRGFKFNQRWSKLASRKNYLVERQTKHGNRLPEEILASQGPIPNPYQAQLRYNQPTPRAEEMNFQSHRPLTSSCPVISQLLCSQ